MRRLACAWLPEHEPAFPTGWHDTLIKAAIHGDADSAFGFAQAWLAGNSIDDAPFRDHRLLLAVVARFGKRLASDPAYPRLLGLQRMLWARSRVALHAAVPALRQLKTGGVDVLLIKGAARLAEGGEAARSRTAHDIDIVIRPEQCVSALDILAAEGWAANKGFSRLYLREHLDSVLSINMWRGEHGDIDLHMRPFPASAGTEAEDRAVWMRALPAELGGVPVLVPAREDRLALALGVNGREAHEHSDWLVDSAVLIGAGGIAWPLFEDIVTRRGLVVPVAIALRYLANEQRLDIPADVVARLTATSQAKPLVYYSEFLHARPGYRTTRIGSFMREVARQIRRKQEKRARPRRMPDRRLSAKSLGKWRGEGLPPAVTEYRFDIPPPRGPAGRVRILGTVLLPVPEVRRRIEFEINACERHVCRIRYRKLSKRKTSLLLSIEGELDLPANETSLVLEARPSRQTRAVDHPGKKARYASVPFHVLSLDLKPVPGGGA